MPKQPPRAARIATALTCAAALTLGMSACSFATLDGVTPGAGTNSTENGVKVMNVVLVGSGTSARVVASVQSPTDDTLVSIGGTPQTADSSNAGTAYTTAQVNLPTPANQLVKLDDRNIVLTSSDSKPGLSARITFTFQKAGQITVPATITSDTNPDYPSASASPSQG